MSVPPPEAPRAPRRTLVSSPVTVDHLWPSGERVTVVARVVGPAGEAAPEGPFTHRRVGPLRRGPVTS